MYLLFFENYQIEKSTTITSKNLELLNRGYLDIVDISDLNNPKFLHNDLWHPIKEDKINNHNLPKEPGLYWATSLPESTKWDFIIEVSGEAPLLTCIPLYYREHEPPPDVRRCPEKLYYGPKIEIPRR